MNSNFEPQDARDTFDLMPDDDKRSVKNFIRHFVFFTKIHFNN